MKRQRHRKRNPKWNPKETLNETYFFALLPSFFHRFQFLHFYMSFLHAFTFWLLAFGFYGFWLLTIAASGLFGFWLLACSIRFTSHFACGLLVFLAFCLWLVREEWRPYYIMKKIMIKLKKPMRQSKKTMEGIEENQGKLKKPWETV